MSAIGDHTPCPEREAIIIDCATRMSALFGRRPMLIGFSVQDSATLTSDRKPVPLDEELSLADVAVHPSAGLRASPELYTEIASAILEMLEAHPGARELLRGYTFARAFH